MRRGWEEGGQVELSDGGFEGFLHVAGSIEGFDVQGAVVREGRESGGVLGLTFY